METVKPLPKDTTLALTPLWESELPPAPHPFSHTHTKHTHTLNTVLCPRDHSSLSARLQAVCGRVHHNSTGQTTHRHSCTETPGYFSRRYSTGVEAKSRQHGTEQALSLVPRVARGLPAGSQPPTELVHVMLGKVRCSQARVEGHFSLLGRKLSLVRRHTQCEHNHRLLSPDHRHHGHHTYKQELLRLVQGVTASHGRDYRAEAIEEGEGGRIQRACRV